MAGVSPQRTGRSALVAVTAGAPSIVTFQRCRCSSNMIVRAPGPLPVTLFLTGARLIKFGLRHHRGRRFAGEPRAAARREHRPARGLERSELSEAEADGDVVIDRLHAAAHEVSLVPEAGAARG